MQNFEIIKKSFRKYLDDHDEFLNFKGFIAFQMIIMRHCIGNIKSDILSICYNFSQTDLG